jgi:hypothetical protein
MFVNFNILNQLGSPAINSNTFANRPAAGQTGRLFVSTDTYEIYRDNGTTWDLIGGPGSSTITGTGTATQVAYFTSSQAIGSSANLFWDNTSGFLGVATATPSARIEAVKTDGVGIFANFTTNAGSGSSTTGLWAKNVTNSSGFAAVIEETTPNATAGQYPLLIKHSLSSGTAGVGMGTGVHWQLPDDAGTFKTTQLTIETINAAAATYATRYRFNVQNNGSSTPVAYINATGLGIFTATPGAALDIHSTGIMAQLNSTSATANSLLAFQRSGSGLWRIGDNYGSGTNYFELFNTVLGINAMQVFAATNKTSWQATETYTTGLARGNYFDYNLSVAAGGSFSSPNAITALGASLDLTLAGNATIPSGARSGLDAYNSIAFTGAGTLTHNQGTQIRAYSNVTAGWAFNGSATGTITHLAGLRALFPDNTGSAIAVTNNYALLLNDQTANTGTVTYTNRWGVYQEGASDLNYFAANTLIGTTVNSGYKLEVNGSVKTTSLYSNQEYILGNSTNTTFTSAGQIALKNNLNDPYISWHADNGSRIGYLQMQSSGNTDFYLAANQPISFYTNTLERLRITAGGNINILSNSVNTAFTSSGQLGLKSSTSDPYISWHADNGTRLGYLQMQNSGIAGLSVDVNQPLAIYTNGLERMRITAAGLLQIAADSVDYNYTGSGQLAIKRANNRPFASFHANNGTRIGFLQLAEDTVSTLGIDVNQDLVFATNSAERARVMAGGNFLIGTTTDAGQKLQVNGNIKIDAGTSTNLITGTVQNGVTALISTTDPVNSDRIYNLGFGSSNYVSQGRIEVYATENWSATNRGCEFRIRTTPNAGTTPTNRIIVKNGGQVRFVPLAADPAGADAGDVYYNSGTNKLRLYDGTNWVDLN